MLQPYQISRTNTYQRIYWIMHNIESGTITADSATYYEESLTNYENEFREILSKANLTEDDLPTGMIFPSHIDDLKEKLKQIHKNNPSHSTKTHVVYQTGYYRQTNKEKSE